VTAPLRYDDSVFINCPFDNRYQPLFDAIVFTVVDCGFVPRCAKEISDATRNRVDKILAAIAECRYGIHDISRTELDEASRLPRFNMPFELGVYFGCRHFGGRKHRDKCSLVLDTEKYRYQQFLSDLSGVDIEAHQNDPAAASGIVRDWLRSGSGRTNVQGGKIVWQRYCRFRQALPHMCERFGIDVGRIPFPDYLAMIEAWLHVEAASALHVKA